MYAKKFKHCLTGLIVCLTVFSMFFAMYCSVSATEPENTESSVSSEVSGGPTGSEITSEQSSDVSDASQDASDNSSVPSSEISGGPTGSEITSEQSSDVSDTSQDASDNSSVPSSDQSDVSSDESSTDGESELSEPSDISDVSSEDVVSEVSGGGAPDFYDEQYYNNGSYEYHGSYAGLSSSVTSGSEGQGNPQGTPARTGLAKKYATLLTVGMIVFGILSIAMVVALIYFNLKVKESKETYPDWYRRREARKKGKHAR